MIRQRHGLRAAATLCLVSAALLIGCESKERGDNSARRAGTLLTEKLEANADEATLERKQRALIAALSARDGGAIDSLVVPTFQWVTGMPDTLTLRGGSRRLSYLEIRIGNYPVSRLASPYRTEVELTRNQSAWVTSTAISSRHSITASWRRSDGEWKAVTMAGALAPFDSSAERNQ